MTSTEVGATLTGYTVAITDHGQQRLADVLRQHGAGVADVPLLRVVPGHLDGRLRTATRRLVRGPVDHVVVTSASGWTRWLSAAAAWDLADPLAARLKEATILSMNPSVSAALQETGFSYAWSSFSGDVGEAVTWLLGRAHASHRVAVTADDPPPAQSIGRLRSNALDVVVVPTRRWAPPVGLAPLHQLARMVIRREVHAVTFTTATVASALIDVTARTGRRKLLLRALATDVAVAATDAESAAPFLEWDIPALWPAGGTADEVARLLVEALVARRREFRSGGQPFAMQGDALLVNGTAIRLTSMPAAVMRSFADYPGHALPRATIEQLVPLARRAGSLEIEQAVRRLRTELGEYGWLVATVPSRGYRLVVD
ncbi:uroporphyrinogen-III synthase [Actinomycetes bacterium KLBMP 9797]